jgi:hypothetical protein
VRATRKRRSGGKTRAYRRAKSARDAGIEFEKMHEVLSRKRFARLAILIFLPRSNARSTRKAVRRPVARTPNRNFCNKKIFRENPAGGSPPLANHRFWHKSITADSAAAHPIGAIDRETS